MKHSSLSKILFYFLMAFSIYMVWSVAYFATGDGACHVHNAIVWRKLLVGEGTFYRQFYEINPNLFIPNYFSHSLLGILTLFSKPQVADKILISIYLLCFGFGFAYFLRAIKPTHDALLVWIFPVLFQVVLFKGFYNYLFGLSFYFFLFGYYLNTSTNLRMAVYVKLCLLGVLIYFVHPVGFLLGVISMALHFLWSHFYHLFNRNTSSNTWRKGFGLLGALLPGLLLMLYFSETQSTTDWFPKEDKIQLTVALSKMKMLAPLLKQELPFVKWYFWCLWMLLALSLILILKQKTMSKNLSTLILLFIFCIGVYYYVNENALGGEYLKTRFAALLPLFAISIISYGRFHPRVLQIITVLGFTMSAMLLYLKLEPLQKASYSIEQLMKLEPSIQNNAFILPLSFHHEGVYQHEHISHQVKIMQNHIASYLQQHKNLVFADNYEGTTNYFPLVWKPQQNPFAYLGNLEGEPPEVNLEIGPDKIKLNYIILFNVLETDVHTEAYQKLSQAIHAHFHVIYHDSIHKIWLYGRNTK